MLKNVELDGVFLLVVYQCSDCQASGIKVDFKILAPVLFIKLVHYFFALETSRNTFRPLMLLILG